MSKKPSNSHRQETTMSTTQLRQGDMFAQPTDLVIIPCSTAATITSFVAKRLEAFDIRRPREYMNLGDVRFELFEGASNIATYVGYAASVEAMRTTPDAISKIASASAEFASQKSEIRDIAIPLLGSSAGGLTPEDSLNALIKGIERVPTEGKVFNLYVYDKTDFKKLSRKLNSSEPIRRGANRKTREPVRVFISYTKTTTEHQEWVRDLARYLRENGVDARLDIWHLRPGMDLPQWMCNEIDIADRILIVCNEEYALKANGRRGGVGWEIRLIQGDLLQTQATNPKKYLPIVRGHIDQSKMPSFLRGVYSMSWIDGLHENSVKETLLRELYEVYDEAPPLGQPPRFVLR